MAGKMRFAAIFVTLSTLLAGGSGTAYYLLTGGPLPPALDFARFRAGDPAAGAALEPHAADFSVADLSAVETAWASAASANDYAGDTANLAPASAEASPTERYDRYAASQHEPIPLIVETAEPVERIEPIVEPTPAEFSHNDLATPHPIHDPQPWNNDRHAAVARGQQPSDEPDLFEPDDDADLAETPSDAAEEPAPTPNSLRAREAFRDESSTAADRYTNSRATGAAVNPFDAQAAPVQSLPAELDELPDYHPVHDPSAPPPFGRASNIEARDAYPRDDRHAPTNIQHPPSNIEHPTSAEGTGRPGERALEGPQQPALVIHKIAPPEIQVGKPAKFLIKIQNTGSQSADDVVLRDEVPQGTRLIGTKPAAETAARHLVWNLGKLSTGEERTVEIELMPTAEGDVGSVATISYAVHASARTRSTMPQLAIRMTAPERVMIGHELRVKIELHNPGSGDATGVMLFENVPDEVRHEAGKALEFEIGTLPAGQTRELELILVAEKPGHVTNVLSARADGNLQVQQQVEFEIIAPELAVAIDGPERRYLERPATYQVIIENPGTAPARDIELVTRLPKGLQFIRANNMGEYDAATHAIYWSLAELPEGERGTVELVAMPIETGTQTLEVEGRAQQGLADQTKQQILIDGLAAIMFEVRDTEDPIEVGGVTTYEIRVVNQGTKAATGVGVTVTLPPAMQLVSAEGETRHAPRGGGIVFEPLAQLPPKTDTLYRVKAKGLQPGDQRVLVEVHTDELTQPIRREESTRVFGDE